MIVQVHKQAQKTMLLVVMEIVAQVARGVPPQMVKMMDIRRQNRQLKMVK